MDGRSAADGRRRRRKRELTWGSEAPCAFDAYGGSRVFRSRREQSWAPLERSNPGRRPRRMTTASESLVRGGGLTGAPLIRATHFRWVYPCHEPAPLFAGDGALSSWVCLGAHPSFLRRGAHSTGNHTAVHVHKRGGRGGPWPKERISARGGADGRVVGVGGRASREVQGAQGLN